MIAILLSLATLQFPYVLSDFSKASDVNKWGIMNDGVMGGLSQSTFSQTKDGKAQFKGKVSLENNGGFASVRAGFKRIDITGANKVMIRLKGDGNNYQFRVKNEQSDRHAYKYEFETSGNWEVIEIPLAEMIPTYRGMRPNLPNFAAQMLSEIGFLIANKKNQNFELLIEKIWLA